MDGAAIVKAIVERIMVMMLNRDARWVAAALQAVIAWEWLVSGVNKLLAGNFPQGLADTLNEGIQNNPNGWYVSILQGVVLPHSVAFGYLIEATELFIGIALFIGVVVLIGPVRRRGMPQYRLAVGEVAAAMLAALLCAFLCVNFHFFMGDGIFPWFDPANAFDEGITLDTLMPPVAVLLFLVNARLLIVMTDMPVGEYVQRGVRRLQALVGQGQNKPRATDGVAEGASPMI
jgi:thiosulfate dehydrogenase [quinone] large subunit